MNLKINIGGIIWIKKLLSYGGANGDDYNWTRKITEMLSTSEKRVSGMSFHYYSSKVGDAVNFTDDEWYGMIKKASKMEQLIERHYAVPLNYGIDDKMKLVIDKWGCWHPDGSGPSQGYNLFEQQSTMRDAVVAALTLNIFNNHAPKILMANVAQLCNNLHALFLSGGHNCIVTPTYHVFDMYKAHQGAECVRTLVSDNCGELSQKLSVSASKKDEVITLTVANLSLTEDAVCDIELLGATRCGKASVTTLCSGDVRAHNTFEEPNKIATVTHELEGNSLTIPRASVISLSIKVR